MFPRTILNNPVWCLYDDTKGNIRLKHPYREGMDVPCPRCGVPLQVQSYHASCCGHEFKTGWGEIFQRNPVGSHERTSGCGWASLRPSPLPPPEPEPDQPTE